MNENFINMYTELNRKYPDIYGRDLRIDAIDRKDRYDDDKLFDETILDVVRIYYKQQTILLKDTMKITGKLKMKIILNLKILEKSERF